MRAWVGIVLAVAVLIGCGTAVAATGSAGAGGFADAGGFAGAAAGGPVAGSRPEAAGLARRLLARLPLPPGTTSAGNRPVPEGMRGLPGAPGRDWLSMTRLLVAPGPPSQLRSYLAAHRPAGSVVTIGDSSMSGEPPVTDVTFELPAPHGIQQAEINIQIQSLTRSTSLVYADVYVVWYPPRTAAEHLTAGTFRSVTVTVIQNTPGSSGQHVSKTITQRTVIAKLIAVIDGLPAAPYYAVPCPLMDAFSLRFSPARPHGAVVTVASLSCVADSVTLAGAGQPALWDSPAQLQPLAVQLADG